MDTKNRTEMKIRISIDNIQTILYLESQWNFDKPFQKIFLKISKSNTTKL